jgi:hypothetical protein
MKTSTFWRDTRDAYWRRYWSDVAEGDPKKLLPWAKLSTRARAALIEHGDTVDPRKELEATDVAG